MWEALYVCVCVCMCGEFDLPSTHLAFVHLPSISALFCGNKLFF